MTRKVIQTAVFLSLVLAIFFAYRHHSRSFTIEEQCLSPQLLSIDEYFGGRTIYVWELGHSNGDDELISKNIVGYLTPHYFGKVDNIIDKNNTMEITGLVFKITPSWAEINIGQSEEQLALEVIALGKRYLLFEPEWRRQYFDQLPKRCKFEN